jgi:hypothetical protein
MVIKDPTITVLSGLWFEAARQGIRRRDRDCGAPPPGGHRVAWGETRRVSSRAGPLECPWLKFDLLAERDTRGLPRVFVDYANVVDDWRREIKRISATLPIDLSTGDEDAIDEFLTPDLHRQRHCGPVTEAFGTDWNSTVWETLCAAARDEPLDGSALDRVFEAYRSERTWFPDGVPECPAPQQDQLARPAVHLKAFPRGRRDGSSAPRDWGLGWPPDAETMIGMSCQPVALR